MGQSTGKNRYPSLFCLSLWHGSLRKYDASCLIFTTAISCISNFPGQFLTNKSLPPLFPFIICWLFYLHSSRTLVVVGWPVICIMCTHSMFWRFMCSISEVAVSHTWTVLWCMVSYKGYNVNLNLCSSLFVLVGSICNCILPEALKISAVRHDPNYQEYDSEKRRLRSAFNCLSSISMRQRQLSTSSMFLHSPLKGCLPPWELRRSNNRSLKSR